MRYWWCILLCLCLTSCADKRYGNHPPYPATGQVLVNGQPAAEAIVVLHHVADWGERTIVPQAVTDEEGRFVLATYDVEDGAPAGDYQVTVTWPAYRRKTIGPDKLEGKYSKAEKSGLTAHIEKRTNVLPAFELRADLSKFKADDSTKKKTVSRRKKDR
jgi:5-hydroxyisourate hydrolase-like protein (transthyretin family)